MKIAFFGKKNTNAPNDTKSALIITKVSGIPCMVYPVAIFQVIATVHMILSSTTIQKIQFSIALGKTVTSNITNQLLWDPPLEAPGQKTYWTKPNQYSRGSVLNLVLP